MNKKINNSWESVALSTSFLFWWYWLVVVTLVLFLFGASMIIMPVFTQKFFGLILFSSSDSLMAFGAPAIAYITLVHTILGSVMVGWSVTFLLLIFGPFRRYSKESWTMFTVSLLAWFLPDTALSFAYGFWQNAVLNIVFMLLFAIPLSATYRHCNKIPI